MKTRIAAIILATIALTSLTLALGSAYALDLASIAANRPAQASWVRINGVITKWGTTDARGLLYVQARTALLTNADKRQFARASVVWTMNLTRAITAVKAKENFTYTFYPAKLLNASVSTFSSSPTTNFLLTGNWNVATIKSEVTVITNEDNEIVSIHRESDSTHEDVYGELKLTDNWTKFELKLTDYEPLTGLVTRSVTRQLMFNWYKLTDVAGTTVTRADVEAVVKCYRSMPGWGNYDNRMDFNFNYKIDIADLATVTANL